MSGGLTQLVAYGAQDIYLTGRPQMTFFKVIYRRHTNFAIESIEQTFNGQADFGHKVSATISRNGDLIHKTYLQLTLPLVTPSGGTSFRWTDDIGHHIIKNVTLYIGGQQIDKHYSDWFQIWYDLSIDYGKRAGYQRMIGTIADLVLMSDAAKPETTLYIPLIFFFNRHAGLALPLIALQYHEVKIDFEFRTLAECVITDAPNYSTTYFTTGTPALGTTSLYVDYIYLDTDERRRFAQVAHEYLIEQLQYTGDESITTDTYKSRLSFNHPVKELIWIIQDDTFVALPDSTGSYLGNQWSNYSATIATNAASFMMNGGGNPCVDAKLQLNGHDRFVVRDGDYFNFVQPYDYHTNIPVSPGVNVYSFALQPEQHQPSGSCNFSRIDNATLQLTIDSGVARAGAKLRVFAVNYNVLRIMSGMGGLAYSN